MPEPVTESPDPQQHVSGCLMRVAWLLVGNLLLIFSAIFISKHRGAFFSAADAVFWVIVLALMGARYFDITRFKGQTAAGQPASMAHWRRYATLLVVLSFCLWGLAHGMALWWK
jgi:hypothetical protein